MECAYVCVWADEMIEMMGEQDKRMCLKEEKRTCCVARKEATTERPVDGTRRGYRQRGPIFFVQKAIVKRAKVATAPEIIVAGLNAAPKAEGPASLVGAVVPFDSGVGLVIG